MLRAWPFSGCVTPGHLRAISYLSGRSCFLASRRGAVNPPFRPLDEGKAGPINTKLAGVKLGRMEAAGEGLRPAPSALGAGPDSFRHPPTKYWRRVAVGKRRHPVLLCPTCRRFADSELLERFRLIGHRDAYAGTLSGGQRKLLEMARALMANPELILLDEPMAGVNPVLVESLLAHIKGLHEVGMTVMFVEHDVEVVMGISDWVVCMRVGKVIAEGTPAAIGANPAVIDAYLGTTLACRS